MMTEMACEMMKQFMTYWGTLGDINKFLLIVVVLDPCFKLDYVSLIFEDAYEADKVQPLTKGAKDFLYRMYEFYKETGTCESDTFKSTVSNGEGESLVQQKGLIKNDSDDS